MENPIILFDGVCNLCNSTVQFTIQRDRNQLFRYAPLQSEFGKKLLRQYSLKTDELDTFVLIKAGKAYVRSTAALKIVRHLKGLWPLLYIFIVVPRPVRDFIYRWVAKNRYRWFGRRDACRIPATEERDLFLE